MSSSNDLAQFSLSPFGKQLIQSGYVTLSQMQQVLSDTRKSGRPLTEILVEVTEKPLPDELLAGYQQNELITLKVIYGVDFLAPDTSINLEAVEALFESFLPFETCRHYRIIPLKKITTQPSGVIVGMVNPNDRAAHEVLNRILVPQRLQLKRLGLTQPLYDQLIQQCLERQPHLNPDSQSSIPDATIVDFERTEVFEISEPDFTYPDLEKENSVSATDEDGNPSVIALVSKILLKGLENKASEIYLEPQKNGSLQVRFRQDGVMALTFDTIPPERVADAIAHLKKMAELESTPEVTPQQGRIKRLFGGQPIDFWLSITPSELGEKIILKILNTASIQPELEQLIVDRTTLEKVKNLVNQSRGLIVVTGKAGAGKTTTLYSLLSHRQHMGAKISTVEAPIERSLSDITQVEVSPERSLDRASIIESFLQETVDVIFVDHIEDAQTAQAVMKAIHRGCLVLTSVVAEDVASAIAQLQTVGLDAATLSENLVGIINQRLVRQVCSTCRLSHEPNQEELTRLGIADSKEVMLYKAKTLTPNGIEQAKTKGMLCRQCSGKGYQAQVGIYEVMEITQPLKTLIAQTGNLSQQTPSKALETYALTLLQQGQTTLEECDRVFPNFNLLTETPTEIPITMTSSTPIAQRLATLEGLLLSLTHEFAQLKEELALSQETPQVTPPAEPQTTSEEEIDIAEPTLEIESPIYEELSFSEPQEFDSMLDDHTQTMISDTHFYEELRDPGTWTDIKKDFEADKETMIGEIPFGRNKANNPNQNQQLPDPW